MTTTRISGAEPSSGTLGHVRRALLTLIGTTIVLAGTTAQPTDAGPRPEYTATISPLPDGIRRWMNGVSWRPGCPVPLRDLRLVKVRYWGFDREGHMGRLVVHEDVARRITRIFRRLYEISFPIRRMRLVDYYGADDTRS